MGKMIVALALGVMLLPSVSPHAESEIDYLEYGSVLLAQEVELVSSVKPPLA